MPGSAVAYLGRHGRQRLKFAAAVDSVPRSLCPPGKSAVDARAPPGQLHSGIALKLAAALKP